MTPPRRTLWRSVAITVLWLLPAMALFGAIGEAPPESGGEATPVEISVPAASEEGEVLLEEARSIFPSSIIVLIVVLLTLSAFFSSCEVAFFSLDPMQLRSLREGDNMLDRLGAGLMEHPGSLLTSILMGNSIVNVLLGVVLASRVDELFAVAFGFEPVAAYALAVCICTGVLVIFGEITPKLFVVRRAVFYIRYASMPIFIFDRLLAPLRKAIIGFVAFIFRITRFSEVQPVPFMTDEEFKSLLNESEASGAIQKNEREMIQGIIEFTDVTVGEILIPRPDMITIEQSATVAEALVIVREHEFARIPVYAESMDNISGILFAKDLLPAIGNGKLDEPISGMLHKAQFVPETMRVAEFMRSAQRLRTHLAVVVDEYGGTEGLVTLHDALREVVGEIYDTNEEHERRYIKLKGGSYRVDGGFSLYELEELLGVTIDDEEHNTVAGFLMEKSEKILEAGDEVDWGGVRYTVEGVDGRRVEKVRISVLPPVTEETN